MLKGRFQQLFCHYTLLLFVNIYFFGYTDLQAQYVPDWTRPRQDTRIDYLAWGYTKATAIITQDNQFSIRWVADHSDAIINYLNHNGSKWTAKLNGGKFVHAPNGDFSAAHEDTRIDYIGSDGSKYSATIRGHRFLVKNLTKNTSYIGNLCYKTWNQSRWTAALNKPNFIHYWGVVPVISRTSPSLQFIYPGGALWTATLLPNGYIQLTDAKGKSHIERTFIYLNFDHSAWGAAVNTDNKTFWHVPARIP